MRALRAVFGAFLIGTYRSPPLSTVATHTSLSARSRAIWVVSIPSVDTCNVKTAALGLKWDTGLRGLSNRGSQREYMRSRASTLRGELSTRILSEHSQSFGSQHTDIDIFPLNGIQSGRPIIHRPKMIDCSPLNADPLPGTSRFLTSERVLCVPPPYTAQPPPPYSSSNPEVLTTKLSTRSIPFGSGVTFERPHNTPPSPDDIIIVTVRINQLGRRKSFDDPLPERCACVTRTHISFQNVLTDVQTPITQLPPSPRLATDTYKPRMGESASSENATTRVSATPQAGWGRQLCWQRTTKGMG